MLDNLPFEIQSDIIKRLPIKSILQFRSVSKQCKSFIDSPEFIKTYHINHPNPQHHLLLLSTTTNSVRQTYTSIIDDADIRLPRQTYTSIIDDISFPRQKFPIKPPEPLHLLNTAFTVGSVCGLICLRTSYLESSKLVVIWNPSIRKYVAIVVPNVLYFPKGFTCFAFGVCPETSDPKLVKIDVVETPTICWEVQVFTLSSRVWKTVYTGAPLKSCISLWDHAFIDGVIYWGTSEPLIGSLLSFDLKSEKFGEVCIPERILRISDTTPTCGSLVKVAKVNESLGLLEFSDEGGMPVCDVWMWKDGVNKPFTKIYTIKVLGMWVGPSSVLGFLNNGDVVLRILGDVGSNILRGDYREDSTVEVYEPSSGLIGGVGIKGEHLTLSASSYMETLLLLDQSNSIIQIPKVNEPTRDEQTKSTAFSQPFISGTQQDVPVVRPNNSKDQWQPLVSQKQDGKSEPVKPGAMFTDLKTSTESWGNKASFGFPGSSGSFSSGSSFSSNMFGVPSSSSEQHSVEEMAKELDALLDSIERPGGFYHASVAAHEPSVATLEEGIQLLSDRCQTWTNTMHQGNEEVQLLLDKTVQVSARKIYMEALVKQATDSQYLDIWNRQKLSSELDMKRRHILEINQNLTNQAIQLERHLNTLELERFGDKSDVQINRKSFHSKHNPPRHVQSLHSLHNTMNAQLAAAEKLSECLSKQMAALRVEPEPAKKQNVKKELFDTIGISYDGSTFSSPGQQKIKEIPPKNQLPVSSRSAAVHSGMKKSFEPETARRRRDSLDRSWASIEPPKTTVKRMLLQEDRQTSPARLSLPNTTQKKNHRLFERSVASHDTSHEALKMSQNRGRQDAQIKRPEEQSLWGNYRQDSLKTPVTAGLFLGSGFQSIPGVTKDAARDSRDDTAEKSRSCFNFTLKSDAGVVNDPKFSQQSQSVPEPSSNTYRPLVRINFQNKQFDFSQFINKDVDSSSIWSRKTPKAQFSAVLSASALTAFSGKSFSLEASTRTSQVGEAVSSKVASLPVPVTIAPSSSLLKDATSSSTSLGKSYTESVAVPVTSALSSFSFKDSASSTASATSLGNSPTGFALNLGATQTVPLSGPSQSFLSFPSTTSSIKPSVNVELNTSKSEPNKLNPVAVESSKPNVVSFPKFDLKLNENSSGQASPPQPVVSSAPSVPTSQPSTIYFLGSQLNLSATSSPALISNSKPEQPSVSPAVSSPPISNPVVGVGGEINSSDQAVTQKDDMEEEAPDTAQLTLGNLGGFGLGSSPNPSAPKQNPFGAPFGKPPANTPITSFGGLFKPASFSIESQQPSQPQQQTNFNAFTGGFASNNNQSAGAQGFGQPAKIGSGQQALGSVLGSFGQSRQFGAGLPGSVASPSPFGSGFASNQSGGFATASSGGSGFANLASGGGGFRSLATSGGGFAGAATGGGGFGAPATGGGGFGAPAASGGGFGAPATGGGGFGAHGGGGFGVAPAVGGFGVAATGGGGFAGAPAAGGGFGGAPAAGGFGGFSSQGGSGFGSSGAARPPSELFTQMRK